MQITKPITLNRHIKLPKLPKNWGKMRDIEPLSVKAEYTNHKGKKVKTENYSIVKKDMPGITDLHKIFVKSAKKLGYDLQFDSISFKIENDKILISPNLTK